MIDRIRLAAHVFLVVLVLGAAGAAGQTTPPQASSPPQSTANPVPQAPAAPVAQSPAPPTAPALDTAAIARRTNQEMGVDIESTTSGWQRELDRLENGLHHQEVRYAQLNAARDQLQRLRSEV